jgi:hypothetical protein
MWFSFYVYSFRFFGFWFDVLERNKGFQSSGLSFAAANPSDAKPRKASKARNGAENSRNAIPQAREAREATARKRERSFMISAG